MARVCGLTTAEPASFALVSSDRTRGRLSFCPLTLGKAALEGQAGAGHHDILAVLIVPAHPLIGLADQPDAVLGGALGTHGAEHPPEDGGHDLHVVAVRPLHQPGAIDQIRHRTSLRFPERPLRTPPSWPLG